MGVCSDPDAWLRPYYASIAAESGFNNLAIAHQFKLLIEAISSECPKQAALMREYNDATQRATLGHLQKMLRQQPLAREEPLWMVRKGDRFLR
jgi:hypothetical protein